MTNTADSAMTRLGEFRSPRQEAAFAQESLDRLRASAYLCIVATTATSLSFAPMDMLVLDGARLGWFLADRLAIALLCLAAVMLIARCGDHRRLVRLTLVHQAVFFSLNALVFDHPVLVRHGGALMPLMSIALFIFMPGSFRSAALLSAYAPAVSLLFWGALRPVPESPADLAILVALTLVAYVVGGLARTQFARIRREEHLHRQTLLAAKEAAEAGARAKADFLAVMSHEIRTPMNGVLGMLRLVLEDPLPERQRQRLDTARQSAEGLRVVLDDILDFSKLEAGSFAIERAPFDLPATLEGVVALMEQRAAEKGLDLALETDHRLPRWIAGDCGRLRQVLFNLVGNAVKFTEQGSVTLRVETGERGPGRVSLFFSVVDTGPGIDNAQLTRLFQPFTQADASISRRYGGTGLGLVICKRLVEGMGGDIAVDSAPGQGSRFHFRLEFDLSAAPVQQPRPAATAVPPLNVLLAEDNPVNQEVTREMLERGGHRVTIAGDGARAVELAESGRFDLVLMDMQMPRVDGLEATRRIRALPAPAGAVPVIALTANALPDDAARCRAAGMNGHLAKPVERDALDAAMAAALGLDQGLDLLLAGDDDGGLRPLLTWLGHRVFPAASLRAAVNLLAARDFDLMVVARPDQAEFLRQSATRLPPLLVAAEHDAEDLGQRVAALGRRASHTPQDLETVMGPQQMARLWDLLAQTLRQAQTELERQPDADTYAALTHRLKGSAATMGLDALRQAAAAADSPAARHALAQALHVSLMDCEAKLCTMQVSTS